MHEVSRPQLGVWDHSCLAPSNSSASPTSPAKKARRPGLSAPRLVASTATFASDADAVAFACKGHESYMSYQ